MHFFGCLFLGQEIGQHDQSSNLTSRDSTLGHICPKVGDPALKTALVIALMDYECDQQKWDWLRKGNSNTTNFISDEIGIKERKAWAQCQMYNQIGQWMVLKIKSSMHT